MSKVAVYGGSFNPFGNHHLDVIRHLAESGEFQHVIVVPSAAHALKTGILPFEHRFNMTVVGVESRYYECPSFPEKVTISVAIDELHMLRSQPGPIFTIQLLRHYRKRDLPGKENDYRFVIGPDILDELDRWEYVNEIREEFGFYQVPMMGIHSQAIREMIGNGVSTWSRHVPTQVAAYIKMHSLYDVRK